MFHGAKLYLICNETFSHLSLAVAFFIAYINHFLSWSLLKKWRTMPEEPQDTCLMGNIQFYFTKSCFWDWWAALSLTAVQ